MEARDSEDLGDPLDLFQTPARPSLSLLLVLPVSTFTGSRVIFLSTVDPGAEHVNPGARLLSSEAHCVPSDAV